MNPFYVWLCVIGAFVVGWIVMLFVAPSKTHPQDRAIQAILNQATNCDRAATEKMRRDCIQQVRNAWGAGEISQDAYESITGYIRNLE